MLNIVTVPNPVLRAKAQKVGPINGEILKLVDEMRDTLENNPRKGVGLAAPQVAKPLRIILVKDGREEKANTFVLINPEITKRSKETDCHYEGCLSIPDTYALVERSLKIVFKAQNPKGQNLTLKAADFFARVIQHEVDHLNGILITDKSKGKILNEEEYNKIEEG